jgi:hypothetical protein
MATWERDAKLRGRMAYLLASAEVAALGLNLYFLSSAYLFRINLTLGERISPLGLNLATWGLAALGAAAALYEAVMYVRGRSWVRRALIAENAVLVALGLLWFLHNFLSGPGRQDRWAVIGGLAIPMVTLFPLLWPLLVFRPQPEVRPGR